MCLRVLECVNHSALETQIAGNFQPGGEPRAVRSSVSRSLKKRRMGNPLRVSVACFGSALALACSSLPPHPKIAPTAVGFSDGLVQTHLENLMDLGPRLPGSEADLAARRYLDREFRLAGARLEELEGGADRHFFATIPGSSEDTVLLVAAYSVLGSDAWVDDSGAVLLLELTRVLARDTPPYTVQLALAYTQPVADSGAFDGEVVRDVEDETSSLNDGDLARRSVREAGDSLASALEASGRLERLRAVIAFEPRAGSAPRMARDLRSHPIFRAVFWEAAAELGYGDSFPSDGGWRSPSGLQEAFRARGLSQILALVDETTARAELQARREEFGVARGGFARGVEPIGSVTLEALARLMRRFERIDAFSESIGPRLPPE